MTRMGRQGSERPLEITKMNATMDDWDAPRAPLVKMEETTKCFKPASSAQIAEWTAWLASSEALAAAETLSVTESQGKSNWDNHKFNTDDIQRHIKSMWPKEQALFMMGPMYLAYMTFLSEQRAAIKDYADKAKNIKTMEDYEKVDEAYKAIVAHINQHGEMHEIPTKTHKKPTESNASNKMGRRAARRARNESEKSEAAKVQYSRADLRALVRAHEGKGE